MMRKLLPILLLAALLLSGCAVTLHDQGRAAVLYLPNADGTGFDQAPAVLPSDGLLCQAVIEALQEAGALPKGVKARRLAQTGDALELDVSAGLAKALEGAGSTEEYLYLGSLVNSILSAYGARTVLLTAGGEPLETGHDVYDYPLPFFTGEELLQ